MCHHGAVTRPVAQQLGRELAQAAHRQLRQERTGEGVHLDPLEENNNNNNNNNNIKVKIETNKVRKEYYLVRQDNII